MQPPLGVAPAGSDVCPPRGAPPGFRPSPSVLRHCRGTRRPTAAAEAPLLPRSSLAPQAATDTPAPRGVPRRYPCPQCLAVHTRPLRAAAGEVPHPALPGGGTLPRQGPVGGGGGGETPPLPPPAWDPPCLHLTQSVCVRWASSQPLKAIRDRPPPCCSPPAPQPGDRLPHSPGTACPTAQPRPAPCAGTKLAAAAFSSHPSRLPLPRPQLPSLGRGGGQAPPDVRGCVPAGAGSEGRVGGQGTPRKHLPAGRAAFVCFFFFFLPQRFLIFEKCCWWVLKTDCVAPEAEILHLHGAGYCR